MIVRIRQMPYSFTMILTDIIISLYVCQIVYGIKNTKTNFSREEVPPMTTGNGRGGNETELYASHMCAVYAITALHS